MKDNKDFEEFDKYDREVWNGQRSLSNERLQVWEAACAYLHAETAKFKAALIELRSTTPMVMQRKFIDKVLSGESDATK